MVVKGIRGEGFFRQESGTYFVMCLVILDGDYRNR